MPRDDDNVQDLIRRSRLYAIGDAIRAKLGVETEYHPAEMAAAIEAIPTLSASVTGTVLTLTGTNATVSNETLDIGGGSD